MDEILKQTREAAHHIIKRKGATYYAVAAGLMRSGGDPARSAHDLIRIEPGDQLLRNQ
jgi:malate/lactate dehydrogenase